MNIVEIIGWTGALMVIVAYFLLSLKKLASDSYRYHGLNIAGSLCFVFYGWQKDASATVMVNVIWCSIGVGAVLALLRAARR